MIRVGPNVCHVDSCPHEGCSREAGCQGHAWRALAPDHYRQRAEALVTEAARDGIVITIEQLPLRPFAMGYHETVVAVRRARKLA